jgi:hypothetical protein
MLTSALAPASVRRLAATLIAVLFLAFLTTGGTALAGEGPVNQYCSSGTTTYDGTSGTWGTGSPDTTTNWSAGLPSLSCEATIPAGATVTLTTTPGAGDEGVNPGGSAEGLTVKPGATLIIQGVSSQGEGSVGGGQQAQFTQLTIGQDGLTIDAGAILDIEATNGVSPFTGNGSGQATGGSASVIPDGTATASVTNQGTINVSSSDSSYGEVLAWNGTLDNTGTINESSGTLTFQGQNYPMIFDNTGSFSVASGASFTMNAGDGSSFTNPAGGTFSNQGTSILTTQGSLYWAQTGGTETGNPIELEGGEGLQDSAGTGAFAYTNCASGYLSGTIPAGQTISILGGCSGTTLTLGTPSGTSMVANHGTLILDSPAGASGSDAILAGGELDNYGTLDSEVGAPYASQLLVPLVNEPGATTNLTGGVLAQTTGSTTSNAGTVNIGPGATWRVQGGAFTNTGTVVPQIAGAANLGQFSLTVEGNFNAGGTVMPTLVSGYAPAVGTEFPFILYNGGSANGTFGSVGAGFAADYSTETANPGYVGLIYKGSTAAGTGPGSGNGGSTTAAAPSASKLSGGAGKLTFAVACAAGATSCAGYTATGTVTEHLKGKKILTVTAAAKKGKKRETASKLVTVASTHGTLSPGKSATVTLKLNAAGTALLKRFHKLKVLLVVKGAGKVISTKTVTVTEPKQARKRKKK